MRAPVMARRRVLIGCEMSGEVGAAFAMQGWEAVSADVLPGERPDMDFRVTGPGVHTYGTYHHYQGDVRDLFDPGHPVNASRLIDLQLGYEADLWNMAVLHPPCDHLSQAGAVWWRQKDATRGGDGRMQEAAAFFMEMVNAPAPLVAVENPVGVMGLPAQACYYRRPDQVVQPWMFGDPLVKRTCLWLKGLPLLEATHRQEDYPELQRIATGGGSHRTDWARTGKSNNGYEDRNGRKNRKTERSRTPRGFARAMAEQWTRFAEEQEKAA